MRIFFLLSCVSFSFSSLAQKAQQAIETLYNKYPQEKIVLSFSKNEYIAGETIFFKAYVLTGYEPSQISTNIYVELYDKKKQVVSKQILPLIHGSGDGGFALPASLAEDVYYIRAYTRYMLNFEEAFQYVRPINIYNPASMNKLLKKPVQWTAASFVEGGTLLHDVPVAVAVRLSSTGSLPERWEGILYEKATNTWVANVEVFNNEVGIVRLIPFAGKEYIVTIKDASGNVQTIDLPKVVETGTSLQLRVQDDKVDYAIYTRNITGNGMGYKLIGTMHDQVVFLGTIKKANGIINGKIDLTATPSGVLRLTLFDEKESPLNERLCFVHQQVKTTTPSFSTDTLNFGPKQVNYWRVESDSISWPTYVAQVSDADYPIVNNFLSDVYLTSDFISPIEDAPWYFQDVNYNKKAALDALLIAETWNRFNWNDLVNDRFPSIRYFPEKYLNYTATVRKGKKPQPLKNINLVFQGKNSPTQFVQVKTDSSGSFQMNDIIFIDTMKVYYQANNRKFLEKDVVIDFELQNKFYPFKKRVASVFFQDRLTARN